MSFNYNKSLNKKGKPESDSELIASTSNASHQTTSLEPVEQQTIIKSTSETSKKQIAQPNTNVQSIKNISKKHHLEDNTDAHNLTAENVQESETSDTQEWPKQQQKSLTIKTNVNLDIPGPSQFQNLRTTELLEKDQTTEPSKQNLRNKELEPMTHQPNTQLVIPLTSQSNMFQTMTLSSKQHPKIKRKKIAIHQQFAKAMDLPQPKNSQTDVPLLNKKPIMQRKTKTAYHQKYYFRQKLTKPQPKSQFRLILPRDRQEKHAHQKSLQNKATISTSPNPQIQLPCHEQPTECLPSDQTDHSNFKSLNIASQSSLPPNLSLSIANQIIQSPNLLVNIATQLSKSPIMSENIVNQLSQSSDLLLVTISKYLSHFQTPPLGTSSQLLEKDQTEPSNQDLRNKEQVPMTHQPGTRLVMPLTSQTKSSQTTALSSKQHSKIKRKKIAVHQQFTKVMNLTQPHNSQTGALLLNKKPIIQRKTKTAYQQKHYARQKVTKPQSKSQNQKKPKQSTQTELRKHHLSNQDSSHFKPILPRDPQDKPAQQQSLQDKASISISPNPQVQLTSHEQQAECLPSYQTNPSSFKSLNVASQSVLSPNLSLNIANQIVQSPNLLVNIATQLLKSPIMSENIVNQLSQSSDLLLVSISKYLSHFQTPPLGTSSQRLEKDQTTKLTKQLLKQYLLRKKEQADMTPQPDTRLIMPLTSKSKMSQTTTLSSKQHSKIKRKKIAVHQQFTKVMDVSQPHNSQTGMSLLNKEPIIQTQIENSSFPSASHQSPKETQLNPEQAGYKSVLPHNPEPLEISDIQILQPPSLTFNISRQLPQPLTSPLTTSSKKSLEETQLNPEQAGYQSMPPRDFPSLEGSDIQVSQSQNLVFNISRQLPQSQTSSLNTSSQIFQEETQLNLEQAGYESVPPRDFLSLEASVYELSQTTSSFFNISSQLPQSQTSPLNISSQLSQSQTASLNTSSELSREETQLNPEQACYESVPPRDFLSLEASVYELSQTTSSFFNISSQLPQSQTASLNTSSEIYREETQLNLEEASCERVFPRDLQSLEAPDLNPEMDQNIIDELLEYYRTSCNKN